jgi:acetoin:2,6-dichlorophenolindophenol oxidoreductase subunit alpha
MTIDELREFEKDIGDTFNSGLIRAPIHLYDGNEELMLKVFEKINIKEDWVCATWRNHYQCLLKGVPASFLKQKILNGKSMVMNLPEYKIVCSSIVGGIPSIATGIAGSIKLKKENSRVWCWVGDMSSLTGAWSEAYRYAVAQNLPITFIVEDNDLSVLTPTSVVWGEERWYLPNNKLDWFENDHLIYYRYKNKKYPHAGAGVRVQF